MTPDHINGAYEFFGGLFLLANCFKLLKDKQIKGISLWASLFFCSWGYWNLYYYPFLNQWWSTVGAIVIVITNTWWMGMAVYYTYLKGRWNFKWPAAFDVCLWVLLFLSVLVFCHYYFMMEVH